MRLKTAIVEDDVLLRTSMEIALESKGIQVTVSAESSAVAMQHPLIGSIDVALLDLHLGSGPSGIEVARSLRSKNPSVGIVFLTSFSDPRLLNVGIKELPYGSRYVSKQDMRNFDELVKILYSAAIGAKSPEEKTRRSEPLPKSAKQLQILKLVAQGLSNSAIAKHLVLSERTVESAISRLIDELNLRETPDTNKRVQLARIYLRARGLDAG